MFQIKCGEIITGVPCAYAVLLANKLFYEITFDSLVINIAAMCRRPVVAEVLQLVQSSVECGRRAVKRLYKVTN